MKKKQESETKVVAIENDTLERTPTERELIEKLQVIQAVKFKKLEELQKQLDELAKENDCEFGIYFTRENFSQDLAKILNYFLANPELNVLKIPTQIKLKD